MNVIDLPSPFTKKEDDLYTCLGIERERFFLVWPYGYLISRATSFDPILQTDTLEYTITRILGIRDYKSYFNLVMNRVLDSEQKLLSEQFLHPTERFREFIDSSEFYNYCIIYPRKSYLDVYSDDMSDKDVGMTLKIRFPT
jgi:hypothetical protein